jgi:hypothetical protein
LPQPHAFELEPVITAAAPERRAPAPAAVPPPQAVSGSFEVPDLDVAPMSRPSPPRTVSGTRPAVAPPMDLEDMSGDLGRGASLDLDLPSHDPLARRVSQSGMQAVRPSVPPVVTRSSYPPPARTPSVPPPASPLPASPNASLPPVGRVESSTPAAPASPRFQIRLAAAPEASLVERLIPGALVLGGAIGVTILDQLYTAVSGEVFTLLGLRTSAIAGLFMLLGIALCVYRLKRD